MDYVLQDVQLINQVGMELLYYKNGIAIYIIITGLIGFFKWRDQLANSYWICFPIFLIALGCFDGIGNILNSMGYHEYSYKLYMFFIIPAEIIFYFWLYSKCESGRKQYFKTSVFIFLLSIIVEEYFKKNLSSFSFFSFSYLIGNLLLLINILIYSIELSKSEKILYFFQEKMFWITVGLLTFWLGSLPYFGLYNVLRTKYFNVLVTYCWFQVTFNYIMYSFFIYMFIWVKKN